MDDLWKFVLYALAIGLYYFIKGRKPADKKADVNPAKPFMSPAASPATGRRPNPVKPPTPASEMPTPLEVLLRQFTGEQPTPAEGRPQPMLEDKVRKSNRKQAMLDNKSRERKPELPSIDRRSLETVDYDNEIPQYRNEASEVDYEVPEKATYKGLDQSGRSRFSEFSLQQEKPSRFAELLKNVDSARDAFVLSEIFRRKEF